MTAVAQATSKGINHFIQTMEKKHVLFKKRRGLGRYSSRARHHNARTKTILRYLFHNRNATARQISHALQPIYPDLTALKVRHAWQAHGLNRQERTQIVQASRGNERIFFRKMKEARVRYVRIKKSKTPRVVFNISQETQMDILRYAFRYPQHSQQTAAKALHTKGTCSTSIAKLWNACGLRTRQQRVKKAEENEDTFLRVATMQLKNLRAASSPTRVTLLRQEVRMAILRHTFHYPQDSCLTVAKALHIWGAGKVSIAKLWKTCGLETQKKRIKRVEEADGDEEAFLRAANMQPEHVESTESIGSTV